MGRRTCHRQELKSLLGHLHHACKVVRPGRASLRRVIDLLARFRNRSHPVRINAEFRRDPQWWLAIFQEWNGISFFLRLGFIPLPDLCAWSRRRTFILPLSHIRCFLQFCHQLARQRTVHNVTLLVSARRLAPSSISVYHSAVRSLHIDHGFADPMLDTPRLHRLIRGYQAFRSSLQAFTLTNHSPIIWRDSTLAIRRFLWPSYVLGSVLSCYSPLMCSSPLTCSSPFDPGFHLSVFDDSIDSAGVLHLHINSSKTDHFRKGHLSIHSAVAALRSYHVLWGNTWPAVPHIVICPHPLSINGSVAYLRWPNSGPRLAATVFTTERRRRQPPSGFWIT